MNKQLLVAFNAMLKGKSFRGTFVKPDRTKIYKELKNLLGKNNVHSIGYIKTALAYLELWNLNKPTNEKSTSNSHTN